MVTKFASSEEVTLTGGVSITDREFQLFRRLIYDQTGISLKDSKATMLSSRLSKRLRQLRLPSFEAYYQLLQSQGPESEEYRELINSITTNKTSFFRESHHFDFLTAQLKQRKVSGLPLRIWSAACSTGEEPYSIAMTVADSFGSVRGRDIRILASDIDTQVLNGAAQAVYDESKLEDIPEEFRERYLNFEASANGSSFRVNQELRDLITFRHRNLISPAWGINTKFDFIFCRNVLIYFDHATQDQILRKFISFLKPHAYLIVGHSEHLHWLNTLIEPVGRTIYRVKNHAAK